MNKFKYEEYNANPYKKKTGDCVIRAVCVALDEMWKETYTGMFEIAIEKGYAVSCKENYKEYLKRKGYTMNKMPRRANNKRYTVKEFIEELANPKKNYIISLANHLTCIEKGTLVDTWNCSRKYVGNYWEV